jgi:hypothetical protein
MKFIEPVTRQAERLPAIRGKQGNSLNASISMVLEDVSNSLRQWL